MMTAVFAARLAEFGINVYEVRPGVIATDMTGPVKAKYDKLILEDERGITPIRRWGQPEDVAKAVVAIASGAVPVQHRRGVQRRRRVPPQDAVTSAFTRLAGDAQRPAQSSTSVSRPSISPYSRTVSTSTARENAVW